MSTSVNDSMKWHLKAKACGVQRGFIPGRHFTDNCLILDTRAREYGLTSKLPIPILFFLDFKAAFPSVSHRWLMDVLCAMKVPL
eukprot:4702132-Karenia_brevis.AAC.1